MRLTVIGASGGIGREFVRQAAAADHEVTAVIRDSARSSAALREWERVPVGGPGRLHVAVVDSLSPGALVGAVSGRDAVVSALGPQGRSGDLTVNSRGRTGRGDGDAGGGGYADRRGQRGAAVHRRAAAVPGGAAAGGVGAVRHALRRPGADGEGAAGVRAGLDDGTAAERLTDQAGTGRPVLTVDRPAPGLSVARADVATAILRLLPDAELGRPRRRRRPPLNNPTTPADSRHTPTSDRGTGRGSGDSRGPAGRHGWMARRPAPSRRAARRRPAGEVGDRPVGCAANQARPRNRSGLPAGATCARDRPRVDRSEPAAA